MKSQLTVRHYKALERLFAAEIENSLPLQSRAKVYLELQELDLAQPCVRTFGYGPFAVEINGWSLTLLGNLTYCTECHEHDESLVS